jgi:hypothetical protein
MAPDLDDALRGLVREELEKAGAIAAAQPAHTKAMPLDLLFLGVLAADCALALVIVPQLQSEAAEKAFKIVEWSATSVFAAAAAWFQQRFLIWMRRKAFRVSSCLLLLTFLPVEFRLVPIRVPTAVEADTITSLDGQPVDAAPWPYWVTLSSHPLLVSWAATCGEDQPKTELTPVEVLRSVLWPTVQPEYLHLSLSLPKTAQGPRLYITREQSFDSDEIKVLRDSVSFGMAARVETATAGQVVVRPLPTVASVPLRLRSDGQYDIRLTAQGMCLSEYRSRRDGSLASRVGGAKSCLLATLGDCQVSHFQ